MPRFCLAVLILALAAAVGGESLPAATGEPDPALVARARAGDADAAYKVGCFYDRTATVAEDVVNAAHWYGIAAKDDHVAALIDLGSMRDIGVGVRYDRLAAFEHFTTAAFVGSVEAAYIVGFMFERKAGRRDDDSPDWLHGVKQAAHWYRKAADEGLPDAQWALARLLTQGAAVPRDMDEAWDLITRAAEKGFPMAQSIAAERYRSGQGGIERDPRRAAELRRKAAERGYTPSRMALAWMLVDGEGLPRDGAEAARWFRRVADGRHPWVEAEYGLGKLYQTGDGVPKDEERAFYWFARAAHAYYQPAIAERDALGAALPQAVATRIERRARADIRGSPRHRAPTKDDYTLAAGWAYPLAWSLDIYDSPSRLCGRSGPPTPVRSYPVVPDHVLPEE